MAHSSSFGINPPTYADGMIFVGLSGGDIQAFNADTLKPLWIYHDALGGQPNCPIIYHDGYLYTVSGMVRSWMVILHVFP